MSAAASLRQAAPCVRDWTQVLPLSEAAECLGVSVDTLQRRCRDELAQRGLAFVDRPQLGGKPQWFVSKGFDARLISETWARRYVDSDLSSFSAKQRAQAFARRECVLIFRAIRDRDGASPAAREATLAACRSKFPGFRVSLSRLYKWGELYRFPCDLEKLVDRRGGARTTTGSDEAWAAFRGLFLNDHQPSIKQCWKAVRQLAQDNGWRWCGYRACHHQLNTRIPPQEQTQHRQPAKFLTSLAPYIAQHAESWRAGQLWIGDHKQLDVICRWQGSKIRPWLTMWIDWRTRKVVGWTLSDSPNSTTILAALRVGILDESNMGGPSHVWIDNGRDYDAWLFHGQTKSQRRERIDCKVDETMAGGILRGLSIEAHFAEPYNPNGKARCERWFRKLESFCNVFPTFTGRDIESKPEKLNEILREGVRIPTFEVIRERLAAFIAGANANAEHEMHDLADEETGELLAPAEAFRRWSESRVAADPASLDLMLQHWHRPVFVGRNGITIPVRGVGCSYGAFAHELKRFKAVRGKDRTPVRVSFDPENIGSIRVFTVDWKYVCTVEMNKLGGMHGTPIAVEHVAQLNREKKRYRSAKATVATHELTNVLTNEENIARIADEARSRRERPAAPAASTTIRFVHTPLDGQAEQIRIDGLRQAAGSESRPFPPRRRPSDLLRNVEPHDRWATTAPEASDRERDDAPTSDPIARLRRLHDTR